MGNRHLKLVNDNIATLGVWLCLPVPFHRRLNQELPYTLTVVTESVQELPGGQGMVIRVNVLARNNRIRSIVVGKGGEIIQGYVALPTQQELQRILQVPVRLHVSVKVAGG